MSNFVEIWCNRETFPEKENKPKGRSVFRRVSPTCLETRQDSRVKSPCLAEIAHRAGSTRLRPGSGLRSVERI